MTTLQQTLLCVLRISMTPFLLLNRPCFMFDISQCDSFQQTLLCDLQNMTHPTDPALCFTQLSQPDTPQKTLLCVSSTAPPNKPCFVFYTHPPPPTLLCVLHTAPPNKPCFVFYTQHPPTNPALCLWQPSTDPALCFTHHKLMPEVGSVPTVNGSVGKQLNYA